MFMDCFDLAVSSLSVFVSPAIQHISFFFLFKSVDHFLPSKKDVNASYAAAERFVFCAFVENEYNFSFIILLLIRFSQHNY